MLYLIEKSHLIFWFFLFPVFGIILQRHFAKGTLKNILGVLALLFLPKLFGYRYIIPGFYELLFFTVLACISAVTTSLNVKKAVLTLGVLLVIFSVVFGFLSFLGYVKIEREWQFGNYKIQKVMDQGFSGRALISYRLSKTAALPIFVEELEVIVDRDGLIDCEIYFSESRITFDICHNRIIR